MKAALSSVLLLVFISGCAVSHNQFLTFHKPLDVGDQLPTGYKVITCDTREGARYMARTGFYHPECRSVQPNSGMRVVSREYENVGEGGMWLIRILDDEDTGTWLVLPWHDWA